MHSKAYFLLAQLQNFAHFPSISCLKATSPGPIIELLNLLNATKVKIYFWCRAYVLIKQKPTKIIDLLYRMVQYFVWNLLLFQQNLISKVVNCLANTLLWLKHRENWFNFWINLEFWVCYRIVPTFRSCWNSRKIPWNLI